MIHQSCQEYVKAYGKPLAGHAFSIEAGQLQNCADIIYAVVPSWQNGRAAEFDLLFEAIFAAMNIANDLNKSSVAIAGVPEDFETDGACTNLLDAVIDYAKKLKVKLEITLVDTNDRVVNCLNGKLQKLFSKEKVDNEPKQLQKTPNLPNSGMNQSTAYILFYIYFIFATQNISMKSSIKTTMF